MIEVDNKDRILGDFFEINADTVKYETESKLPKFILNIKVNNLRKKLIKKAESLRGHIILNRNNIYELLNYILDYNDENKYGCISLIKRGEDSIEALIIHDTTKCLLFLDNSLEEMDISLETRNKNDEGVNFKIRRKALMGNEQLIQLNDLLTDTLVDFLTSIIKLYLR